MSKLSKRITEFMVELNLNAPQLAKELSVDRTDINRFLRAERTPNYSCFINMVYYFICSADYLLGLTDIHTEEPLHEVLPFGERLRGLLKEQKISQAQLIRELPISSAVPYKWLSGKNFPSLESLIRLAQYLDCSVDYLIGRVR